MSNPTYELDAYRTSLEADVVSSGSDETTAWVLLDDTVLYPEGGGQPDDSGTVAGLQVTSLTRTPHGIRHDLVLPQETPLPTGTVLVELDWTRRFDHMQQHTAQHLLTALAHTRFGWATTSFHLGSSACDIELDTEEIAPDRLDELEELAAAEIRAARPVSVERIAVEEYRSREDIRTRGLPDHHHGDVRLVVIDGIDRTACGGTHVATTAEIGPIKLLAAESMRGGTRLHWVAGSRVRTRLAGHERRAEALRAVLGVANDELPRAARERMDQLKELQKRVRAVEEQLAEAHARALLHGSTRTVDAHFEGKDGGFLRMVAHRFADLARDQIGLFTSEWNGDYYFAVAGGPDGPASVDALGNTVAELLAGRGGGKGPLFQGRAGSLDRRDEAVSAVRAAGS